MSTYNETGHFKNVSNLEDLISYCSSYGTTYNPSQSDIKLASLQQLHSDAATAFNNFTISLLNYKKVVAGRTLTFNPLAAFCTRIINVYSICGVSDQNVNTAKYYVDKIRGGSKKKSSLTGTDGQVSTEETNGYSTSQKSFDSKVENFSTLVALLELEPLYQPNETELQLSSLKSLLAEMKSNNTAVINAQTELNNVRIQRDALLYAEDDGLVDIALDVKKYVKGIFGATSSQFKQVNSVRFKILNRENNP